MSEMEVYYGRFKKSDIDLEEYACVDDAEEELNLNLVDVNGDLYEFESIKDLDQYGFSLLIEPSDETRFICYWYNGGAGIHEVVEEVIRKYRKKNDV